MKKTPRIQYILGREILDSRGNPTIEADVYLDNGAMGRASVPSGASTGIFEACELRDAQSPRYLGKGVLKAAENIRKEIAPALVGRCAFDQAGIDRIMIELDGTPDKSRIGANAILGVSLACAKAAADCMGVSLFRYIGGVNARTLPVPMMNILNGGMHAANNVDIQEFMIVPVSAKTFGEALRQSTEVYHTLKRVLDKMNLSSAGVGDEGGYAPMLEKDEDALSCITRAITDAGYEPGRDFMIAIDAASSGWYDPETQIYSLPKSGEKLTREQLLIKWKGFCEKYPVFSLEDAMAETDWQGWDMLTKALGSRHRLIGDDLFATNIKRLKTGIEKGAANSVLIKPNQIGTLTETLDTVRTAQRAGYTAVISHRSGETEDTVIADLAVAVNAGLIKSGAPGRSDRTAKYNRLLRIEEELGNTAVFGKTYVF